MNPPTRLQANPVHHAQGLAAGLLRHFPMATTKEALMPSAIVFPGPHGGRYMAAIDRSG